MSPLPMRLEVCLLNLAPIDTHPSIPSNPETPKVTAEAFLPGNVLLSPSPVLDTVPHTLCQ